MPTYDRRATDGDCRHVPGSTPQRFSAPSPSPLSTSAHKERPSHFSLPIHVASAALLPHAHELPSPCETRGQGSPLDKGAARSLRAAPPQSETGSPDAKRPTNMVVSMRLAHTPAAPASPDEARLQAIPAGFACQMAWLPTRGFEWRRDRRGVTPRVPSSAVPSRRAPARGHER